MESKKESKKSRPGRASHRMSQKRSQERVGLQFWFFLTFFWFFFTFLDLSGGSAGMGCCKVLGEENLHICRVCLRFSLFFLVLILFPSFPTFSYILLHFAAGWLFLTFFWIFFDFVFWLFFGLFLDFFFEYVFVCVFFVFFDSVFDFFWLFLICLFSVDCFNNYVVDSVFDFFLTFIFFCKINSVWKWRCHKYSCIVIYVCKTDRSYYLYHIHIAIPIYIITYLCVPHHLLCGMVCKFGSPTQSECGGRKESSTIQDSNEAL